MDDLFSTPTARPNPSGGNAAAASGQDLFQALGPSVNIDLARKVAFGLHFRAMLLETNTLILLSEMQY
jgi:hypothetical protein